MSLREIKFSEALAEATLQAMEEDPKLFLIGEGIDDPKGAFGTTLPALKRFGEARVLDSPLSESAVTGITIGAALEGHPSIFIHMRAEFMLLAMDQILNHAAKWHYMFGGRMNVPVVFRCIVGRGWGQAAQHSQSFHALFSHVPGLKVILPSNAYDAKGLLYSAIKDPNPVICIEHRWLYDKTASVPEEPYGLPIGKANVVTPGKDVTCIAVSHQVWEACQAREKLLSEGIELEVIDLRSAAPLDTATILASVKKTGRVILADIAHRIGGISAEIAAQIAESGISLKAPVARIGLPHAPTPCSWVLESSYYPNAETIVATAKNLLDKHAAKRERIESSEPSFLGPF